MDRLSQLRGEAGGSGDSTLDTSAAPSEAYMTANESSKYFSLTEDDSTFDITPIKDVSLASTVEPDKTITGNEQLISNLSPIAKKSDLLDGYKFGKQIEAANILSGGVDIFDDNDNSYDGDELVIDDNAEVDEKSNSELKLIENTELPFQKTEDIAESLDSEPAVGSKDSEVVLQIDGKNVNAIDIGNGLYLYRKAGEEELAAVQIVADENDQPSFKFLKVRENAEGNLEVYEEIEIKVPKEVPTKDEKSEKNTSHVPIKDISKVINEPLGNKVAEKQKPQPEIKPIASTSNTDDSNKIVLSETKTEINLNGKMKKFNETRKSPVIHSTPNKEGIPLTKTMVDMQLHPGRPLDKVKTIEVHTDNVKQKMPETSTKKQYVCDDQKLDDNKVLEKPAEIMDTGTENKETVLENKGTAEITSDATVSTEKEKLIENPEKAKTNVVECSEETSSKMEQNKPANIDVAEEAKLDATETKEGNKAETNDKNVATLSDTLELPKKNKENSGSKEIQKENTNLPKIEHNYLDTVSVPSLISNLNNSLEKKEKDEETKDENLVDQVELKVVNKIESNSNQELDLKETNLNTLVETIAIRVPGKDENKDIEEIKKSENVTPKIANEVILVRDSPVKINSSIPAITDTSQKVDKVNIEINVISQRVDKVSAATDLDNKPKNLIGLNSQGPNYSAESIKDESKAQVTEQSTAIQLDIINSKDTSAIDNKQIELKTPQKVDAGKITASTKPETKLIQEKPVKPDAKVMPFIETKQANANKPIIISNETIAFSKFVPETLKKEDSKLQGSNLLTANKEDILKRQNLNKTEYKPNKLPPTVPVPQKKPQISNIPSSATDKKPINNNAAVPFGQWTSANRQEFLNKIKETKIPANVSNTKSISKPNDLNRRDVLQKIDSQRQSNNAASKNQELSKLHVKMEAPTFINKPVTNLPNAMNRESKAPLKVEAHALKNKPVMPKKVEKVDSGQISHRLQSNSTVTSSTVTHAAKTEAPNRNEYSNQDLIDKTVEGIINRAVVTKPQETKPKEPIKVQHTFSKESIKPQPTFSTSLKSRESKPSILDAIEMKMNELHGIPFVERPPHELPKVYNRDIKTYAKADNTKSSNRVSKIPNLLPVTKIPQKDDDVIDLDSEEEVIEHEPITGDIEFNKKNITSKQSNTSAETNMAQIGSDSSKKESIITEKDFDKFVRRNSVTYENCLTVNIEANKNRNVVQGVVPKDLTDKNIKETFEIKKSPPIQKSLYQNHQPNKINITSKLMPVSEDVFNKNYQSKLQLAYQTALTTKRQMESPITILEDKPVKVVFMDSNPSTNFQASQLNVQGQGLSPSKKPLSPKAPDSITISTTDSLDSEVLDSIEDTKPHEESKSSKTKHQRKQVLTPVETPELELIVPGDLGIEVSPKKKRRIDDFKVDKSPKNLVPKKSYLLGRNANAESPAPQIKDATKHVEERNTIVTHKDTASAIDNLVKAAELIENQSGSFKTDVPSNDTASPITPVKRGRGRPRKYPLPEGTPDPKAPSPQKKPRLIESKEKGRTTQSASDDDTSNDSIGDGIVRENWTMGKINENIVCPICNKLFRSENVVFKHVKHCTGPSPNRSESDKRSRRRSRMSNDSKSMDSKLDDTDGDTDSVISKKSLSKKRKSKEPSSDSKEEIITIQDTPVKDKVYKGTGPKQHESRKPTKTKAQYKMSSTTSTCEHCGKTFRQQSYLLNHLLQHKNHHSKQESENFVCEVCKKEFRKLYHLAQHRVIHEPSANVSKPRKSSSEQNVDRKPSKEKEIKQAEDQSAAFRCEPCDKSFRKLHHLVEHRETHDGINRQKGTPTTQTTEKVIQNPPPPPQCDICKKSFRKLHHLIEHKEQQHIETSSEKSDDKSVKSSLSTKDIIHECPLCYMVFPNEHSLNKHSVFCQKKKRQSVKPVKPTDEPVVVESDEVDTDKQGTTLEPETPKPNDVIINIETPEEVVVSSGKEPTDITEPDVSENLENLTSKEEVKSAEVLIEASKSDLEKPITAPIKVSENAPKAPQKPQNIEEITEESKNTTETPKKKTPAKGVSTAKRRKSNLPLARIKEAKAVESSDDDEVRYMINPDYKDSSPKPVDEPTSEGKLFMKVRAKKRNSLQFDKPSSKDLVVKRRTSLQHPPKVPRLKAKVIESNNVVVNVPAPNILKTANLEPVPSTDSDDSDVKYSFPEKVQKTESEKAPTPKRKSLSEKVQKTAESEKTPKEKKKPLVEKVQKTVKTVESEKTPKENRKSLADKRKTLSGIARRKSLGKTQTTSAKHKPKASPVKEVKRKRAEVEHRCDCGQLFSSAALLARHTSLAHTPPRVRRRRVESPPPAPAPPAQPAAPPARKSSVKATDTRKSSVRSDNDAAPPKAKPGRPPGKTPTRTPVRKSTKPETTASSVQSRKSVAHRGVPVPEKMKKIMEKLKK